MPCVVNVAMTVDCDDPDRAVEFVRAELLSKPGVGNPTRQIDQSPILPRWQMARVRRAARQDGCGAAARWARSGQ